MIFRHFRVERYLTTLIGILMIAFAENLKSFAPINKILSKTRSYRKYIFENIIDVILIVFSIYLALNIEGWAAGKLKNVI